MAGRSASAGGAAEQSSEAEAAENQRQDSMLAEADAVGQEDGHGDDARRGLQVHQVPPGADQSTAIHAMRLQLRSARPYQRHRPLRRTDAAQPATAASGSGELASGSNDAILEGMLRLLSGAVDPAEEVSREQASSPALALRSFQALLNYSW